MASPADSASGDNAFGKPKAGLEQITFRFCSECSNMLYPKEDEDAHKLQFTCRTCQYTEEATSMCIFRNVLNNAAGETAGVTQDVGQDPTVGSPSLASVAELREENSGDSLQSYPYCIHCGDIIMLDYGAEDSESDTTSTPMTPQFDLADLAMTELLEQEEEEDIDEWEDVPIGNSKEWEEKFQEGLPERLFAKDDNRTGPVTLY